MQIRYSRIICCLLAALMLFSGMCLNDRADSLAECKSVNSLNLYIDSLDKEVKTNESCTIEMLGIHNTIYVMSIVKRSNIRMYPRICLNFLHSELFLCSISNICTAVNTAKLPELYYRTAILDYIQSKDGKK